MAAALDKFRSVTRIGSRLSVYAMRAMVLARDTRTFVPLQSSGTHPMPSLPTRTFGEGRRIQAVTIVKEQDIAAEDASGHDILPGPRARLFADLCGIGSYAMDVHSNHLGQDELYIPTRPYQIPLGALVPVRVTNLLPACKNLGVTHLTNGAYRLHPIEWNVGEAAGALGCFLHRQRYYPPMP